MRLRLYYLNEQDKVSWYEIATDNVGRTMDELGRTVAQGALLIAKENNLFSFAVPSSRLLKVERVKPS